MEEENYISIDFASFLRILKKEKWVILLISALVVGGSIAYALSLKDEFTASGKILPEMKGGSSKMSGLSGLASLAGVSLDAGGGTEAIRPDLYPDVLQSTPFFLYLMKQEVPTVTGKKVVFRDYALKHVLESETLTAKDTTKNYNLNDGSISLSLIDFNLITALKKRISAAMDKKTGVITISAKMRDRYVATSISNIALNYLTNYITDYRTQKSKDNVLFFEEQMKRAKSRFYNTQSQKAEYADNFQQQYMRSRATDVQRERIETEYMFSANFYKSLEQQYEQSKIELQREIPVIKVLEPPVVPNLKSEPKRSIIVLGAGILGLLLGLIVSMFKNKNYKQVFVSTAS